MLRDKGVFSRLRDKKVIINRSVLNESDIKEFASEAGIKIFDVIPCLNDRELSKEISSLLVKLGMVKSV